MKLPDPQVVSMGKVTQGSQSCRQDFDRDTEIEVWRVRLLDEVADEPDSYGRGLVICLA
jgi:hypothetical protein